MSNLRFTEPPASRRKPWAPAVSECHKVSPFVCVRRSRKSAVVVRAKESSATGWDSGSDMGLLGFPSYLQKSSSNPFPCAEPRAPGNGRWPREQAIWQEVRKQAQLDAASEPLLSSFLYASVLAHDSFEKALAFVLANRLANTTLLPTHLFEIFVQILQKDDDVRCGVLADLDAVLERDPACLSLLQPLLYGKGYHAIQTHRIAHCLWSRGQRVMALALQSRSSEVFAVDIHPAARFGKGILLDHGTGVVIGETAVLGDNCSLLQNVTLGGTGKETGDRHPKIGENVLIGANATVLGNIQIGCGAQIAAGSLVLKEVGPNTMVAGSPAKEVGKVTGNPAMTMSHWNQDCTSGDESAGEGDGSSRRAAAAPQQAAVAAVQGTKAAAAPSPPTNKPKSTPVSAPPPPHWPISSRTTSVEPVLPGEGI